MSREIRFVDNLLNNLFFISPAECHYSRMRNFSRGLGGTRRRERRPVHYRLQHPKCSSRGKPNYRDTRNRSPGSQRGVDQHMCHTNQSKAQDAKQLLCALRLLTHFFTKGELADSNTDGSHNKRGLDSGKLNLLKILVFSKFPASNS